jgi:hypothetical protein
VTKPLRGSPVQAQRGESAIAPVEIDGLLDEIEALGRRWQRKVEFHMTVLGAARIEALARKIRRFRTGSRTSSTAVRSALST